MATDRFDHNGSAYSAAFNTLALAGICGVLAMAFFWQFVYNDVPCPLCLLQRVAFVMVGIGLLMNVRFGPSALHYGVIVLSSLGGAFAAGRQVLLHIAPGDAGYGPPFLGMHFYTWALVLFIALLIYAGVMLMLDRHCFDQAVPRRTSTAAQGVMWLFFFLVAANMVSTLLECGFGQCADNPVGYLWLGGA